MKKGQLTPTLALNFLYPTELDSEHMPGQLWIICSGLSRGPLYRLRQEEQPTFLRSRVLLPGENSRQPMSGGNLLIFRFGFSKCGGQGSNEIASYRGDPGSGPGADECRRTP